jgi:hypothetical protein
MQIMGVDLHTRQQTVAMLDVEMGEVIEKTLQHEDDSVREFYSTLAGPTRVGIEASGSMQWSLELGWLEVVFSFLCRVKLPGPRLRSYVSCQRQQATCAF